MSDQPTLPSSPQEPPLNPDTAAPRLRAPRPDRYSLHTPQGTPTVSRAALPHLPESTSPTPTGAGSALTLSPADYRTGVAYKRVRTFKVTDGNAELDEILNGDAGETRYVIEDRKDNFFEGTSYVTLTYTEIHKK